MLRRQCTGDLRILTARIAPSESCPSSDGVMSAMCPRDEFYPQGGSREEARSLCGIHMRG